MEKFFASLSDFFKLLTAFFQNLQVKPPTAAQAELPWMKIALKELGQAEKAGETHNKRIVEYHQTTSLKATTDEVPWCASFISWVFVQAKLKSRKSARARDWLTWGVPLEKPVYGCLVVFSRGAGGHVAFYRSGYKSGLLNVLGGNQSNRVKWSNYYETNVLGYRWPSDWPLPEEAQQ